MVRSKITEIERNKLIAIITIEQHAWKVLGKLVEKGVSDVNDFEWMQQLRFYLDKERPELDYGICLINQTNTSFEYGYEY